jgi:hypothetical protein
MRLLGWWMLMLRKGLAGQERGQVGAGPERSVAEGREYGPATSSYTQLRDIVSVHRNRNRNRRAGHYDSDDEDDREGGNVMIYSGGGTYPPRIITVGQFNPADINNSVGMDDVESVPGGTTVSTGTVESNDVATAGEGDGAAWACSTCTFENTAASMFCDMCGTGRP